jgi:hypothetical protein
LLVVRNDFEEGVHGPFECMIIPRTCDSIIFLKRAIKIEKIIIRVNYNMGRIWKLSGTNTITAIMLLFCYS